jgi:hypothetical protein
MPSDGRRLPRRVLPIAQGLEVSAAAQAAARLGDRSCLVAELRGQAGAWLRRAEDEWARRRRAIAQVADGFEGGPVANPAAVSRLKRAAVLAYRRGYRVQPDGSLTNPQGRRLRASRVQVVPEPKRPQGTGAQRPIYLPRASLAGFSVFGAAYLAPGARLLFVDGNPANLAWANLRLSDRTGVRRQAAQRQRARRAARGAYPRPEHPTRKRTGAAVCASLTWEQVQQIRLLLDSGRMTRRQIAERWAASHPDGPRLTYDTIANLDLGRTYI